MPDPTDSTASAPLIVTLTLDDAAQAFYEDLRCRYFPRERNHIPAHLTLFHHLRDEVATRETLQTFAQRCSNFRLTEATPRSIGRGVAVFFQTELPAALHASLSAIFAEQLIPQDRQSLRPHIVVQNKVEPATAQRTLTEVSGISLVEPVAVGLSVWRYLGGPWEPVCELPFG